MQSRAASFNISGARILSDTSELFQIGLPKSAWSNSVFGGGIFVVLGLFLLSQGSEYFITGALGLLMGVMLAVTQPVKANLVFDFRTCQVLFAKRNLLPFPVPVERQWNFSQVASASLQRASFGQQRLSVLMADGNCFVLVFGKKNGVQEVFQRIQSVASSAALVQPEEARVDVVEQAQATESLSRMERELRSWSIWLFVIGVIQMISAGGFSTWGALLMIVAGSSLYFREAPMFIVFAATAAWAAFNNLLSGQGTWIGFSVVQVFIVFQTVGQYRQFSKYSKEEQKESTSRTRRWFPWVSLILGAVGLAGLLLLLGAVFLLSYAEVMQEVPAWMGIVEPFLVYAGVLSIGTGAGSLASRFPQKAASIAGIVGGVLVILIELGLILFM